MDIEELSKISPLSIQLATSAWVKPKTSKIEMNTALVEEFAFILYEEIKKPNLGNAKTRELLNELKCRLNIDLILNPIINSLSENQLEYKTTNYK